MQTSQIREAAGLLRAGWCKNDYSRGETVCVMGSLAKMTDPSLTTTQWGHAWELAAHRALREDPRLRQIITEELDAIYAAIPEKTPKQKRHLAEIATMEPVPGTALKVCLTNLTVFETGEDAAAFLDRVADRHAPPEEALGEALFGWLRCSSAA